MKKNSSKVKLRKITKKEEPTSEIVIGKRQRRSVFKE